MTQSPAVINVGRQGCAFGMGLGYVDKGCQIESEVSVLETLGVIFRENRTGMGRGWDYAGLYGTIWDGLVFQGLADRGVFAILQCSVFETNSFGFSETKLRRSDWKGRSDLIASAVAFISNLSKHFSNFSFKVACYGLSDLTSFCSGDLNGANVNGDRGGSC